MERYELPKVTQPNWVCPPRGRMCGLRGSSSHRTPDLTGTVGRKLCSSRWWHLPSALHSAGHPVGTSLQPLPDLLIPCLGKASCCCGCCLCPLLCAAGWGWGCWERQQGLGWGGGCHSPTQLTEAWGSQLHTRAHTHTVPSFLPGTQAGLQVTYRACCCCFVPLCVSEKSLRRGLVDHLRMPPAALCAPRDKAAPTLCLKP